MQIANTTGRAGFQLSFKLQSLDNTSTRITTWRVDYGIGTAPTSFTDANALGTLTTGNSTFASNNITVNFGSALDNQSQNVWMRVVALTASTGSGTRATTGIDDLVLTWNALNVWDGFNWSLGSPPTSTQDALINGPYPNGTPGEGNFSCANLVVAAGQTLSIEANRAIQVAGNLDYQGATIEMAATTSGPPLPGVNITNGSLIMTNNGSSILANAGSLFRVTQIGYTPSNQLNSFHHVAAPMGGIAFTASQFPNFSGGLQPAHARYVEANNNALPIYGPNRRWQPVAAGSTLAPGVGYTVVSPGNASGEIIYLGAGTTGRPGNGIYTVPITRTALPSGDGYNLVGNPYPSDLNLTTFFAANPGLEGTVWLWAPIAPSPNGQNANWVTLNATNTAGSSDFYVAPGQGFWVRATAIGTTNVTFNNAMRTETSWNGLGGSPARDRDAYRTENDLTRLCLQVRHASGALDETWIAFSQAFTNGFDQLYDGRKQDNPHGLDLCTELGSERWAIAALPPPERNFALPLTLRTNRSGSHWFMLREAPLPAQERYLLEDRTTGEWHYLAPGRTHELSLPQGIHRGRFFLRRTNEVTNGVAQPGDPMNVYASGNQLLVRIPYAATVAVYNLLGLEIARFTEVAPGAIRALSPQVPHQGVYIVRINTAEGSVDKRVWLEK
ncbi:MAG: T9SS type A sorting domain-containing protein [Bernardetiaceae bacterium]|nr:T9SS type A sorting domain-containing protein [Bernardetiaceae bacterium]